MRGADRPGWTPGAAALLVARAGSTIHRQRRHTVLPSRRRGRRPGAGTSGDPIKLPSAATLIDLRQHITHQQVGGYPAANTSRRPVALDLRKRSGAVGQDVGEARADPRANRPMPAGLDPLHHRVGQVFGFSQLVLVQGRPSGQTQQIGALSLHPPCCPHCEEMVWEHCLGQGKAVLSG